jgi:hypothetical protein
MQMVQIHSEPACRVLCEAGAAWDPQVPLVLHAVDEFTTASNCSQLCVHLGICMAPPRDNCGWYCHLQKWRKLRSVCREWHRECFCGAKLSPHPRGAVQDSLSLWLGVVLWLTSGWQCVSRKALKLAKQLGADPSRSRSKQYKLQVLQSLGWLVLYK